MVVAGLYPALSIAVADAVNRNKEKSMRNMGGNLAGRYSGGYPGGAIKDAGPLRVRCAMDGETGRITRKTESAGERSRVYDYEYDEEGRLFRVFRNELLIEQYLYTGIGQRLSKSNGWANESVRYGYGDGGCLLLAASVPATLRFGYDGRGNLTRREEGRKVTSYVYADTRLQRVALPDGTDVAYTYDPKGKNPLGPVAKYYGPSRRENPAMEYAWKDLAKLSACVDHRRQLRYDFAYDGDALARVRLRGPGVARLFRTNGNDIELFVGCDQVNTPKIFTDRAGREVKWIEYDSFGIVLEDSYPELFIPVGFAGGLADRDTGFVRFGFRDYDPAVGRFTCPDPMGDTGGDHDLYDYCVDDPVNMRDPMGLFGEGGWTGFMQQQGLKEWETQVPQVKPEHQTPEGKRAIDRELEKPDTVGTPEFDQKIQKEEVNNFGRGSDSRRVMQNFYGKVDDDTFAKLGMPMPPKANMDEMRQHPDHSEELERILPKDPTPVRVEITRNELKKENELRQKKEESTVTKSQMIQDYMKNPQYMLEDLKNPPNAIGALYGGVAGKAGGFIAGQAVKAGVTWGLKKMDEVRKKPSK